MTSAHRRFRIATLTIATLLPIAAVAHPGHEAGSALMTGLLHPLTGLDHVLVIAAVSAWAARLHGRARFAVLAALAAAVPLGALMTPVPADMAWLEAALATTVVASGLLLAFGRRLPLAVGATLATGFALLHGVAHGLEGPRDAAYVPGLALATVALTAVASLAARRVLAHGRDGWLQAAGVVSALSGVAMLA